MKKGLRVYMIAASLGLLTAANVHAQDTTTIGQDLKSAANKTGHAVKKSAKKVGNKSAELASKGKAAVVDKIYDGKQGPNGQTIYINSKAKYYWIDKKGRRHYITESELIDKAD
ncbi:MAG: hypothetical protein JWP81_1622 [Ferruginibacter sp.]|nr:hypothetical protein [Ferruginibacter sp.]